MKMDGSSGSANIPDLKMRVSDCASNEKLVGKCVGSIKVSKGSLATFD
jgi:hypothetical protein